MRRYEFNQNMYVYPIAWKVRFLILYFVLVPIINVFAYIGGNDLTSQPLLEMNALIIIIFSFNWLVAGFSLAALPSKRSLAYFQNTSNQVMRLSRSLGVVNRVIRAC